MNAITLIQPWAMAITYLGKRVENRTWRPPAAAIGMPLAIHAGKGFDEDGAEWIWRTFGTRYVHHDVPKGAVIAVCRLSGFVKSEDELSPKGRPWFFGPIGWTLEDVTPIEPVFCRGQQGLWRLSELDASSAARRFGWVRNEQR